MADQPQPQPQPQPVGVHPVVGCVESLERALRDVVGVDPGFMATRDKAEVLRRLGRVEAALGGLRLRVMAGAGEVAEATADHSVATWLAVETRTDPRVQAGDLGLARGLEARWTRLRDAVAEGGVNLAQARVVAAALEELPVAEVGVEAVARAEEVLVGYAGQYGPRELRRLGRRVLEVAAPQECERREAAVVEGEERRAAARARLSLRRLGDGTTAVTGRVPDAVADRLRTYLDAYTSPRHRGPGHGGDATTVIVTVDREVLAGRLAGVGLVGEEPISAGQVRRLACTAQIIPAVLGGKGEVLDLGRGSRLFKPAQRKAMALRDKRCRAEGCSVPAAWCEAHHATRPWTRGGRTDLADGVLLCSWHHHRAHDPRYRTEPLPTGDHRYHRRT